MIGREDCAGVVVFVIRISCTRSGVSLHVDLMPELGQLINNRWKRGHPAFLLFDLFRDADFHTWARIQKSEFPFSDSDLPLFRPMAINSTTDHPARSQASDRLVRDLSSPRATSRD